MDRGARQATVHRVAKSWTRLSNFTHFTQWASLVAQTVKCLTAMRETRGSIPGLGRDDPLEKGKATHSSILAWRIPWTEDLRGYGPWDHKELDMTMSAQQARPLGWAGRPEELVEFSSALQM